MKAFEFEKLSKYRGELFGFSILSILLVHYTRDVDASKAAVSFLERGFTKYYRDVIGSQGVDIFIFLSGMGLYFAMQKTKSMYAFYKKRLLRVLVPYLLSMPVFLFIMDFIVDKTKPYNYINHLSFGSFWLNSGQSYVWFIALILVLYIVFPFIYEMVNAEHGLRNMLAEDLGLCGRTPFMAFISKYFKFFFREWAGIGLMIIAAVIFSHVPDAVRKFFRFFSGITLELYISHEIIRKVFKINKLPIHKSGVYFSAMLISLGLAFLLHWLSEKAMHRILEGKVRQS